MYPFNTDTFSQIDTYEKDTFGNRDTLALAGDCRQRSDYSNYSIEIPMECPIKGNIVNAIS